MSNSNLRSRNLHDIAPCDLLRYAQRRWPLAVWVRVKRRLRLGLANINVVRIEWRIALRMYRAKSQIIKDLAVKLASHVCPDGPALLYDIYLQRHYDALSIAYSSMTAADRNKMVPKLTAFTEADEARYHG